MESAWHYPLLPVWTLSWGMSILKVFSFKAGRLKVQSTDNHSLRLTRRTRLCGRSGVIINHQVPKAVGHGIRDLSHMRDLHEKGKRSRSIVYYSSLWPFYYVSYEKDDGRPTDSMGLGGCGAVYINAREAFFMSKTKIGEYIKLNGCTNSKERNGNVYMSMSDYTEYIPYLQIKDKSQDDSGGGYDINSTAPASRSLA